MSNEINTASTPATPVAGIIAGTGFEDVFTEFAKDATPMTRQLTPYGDAFLRLVTLDDGAVIAFLPRHGERHGIPPHRINHAANLYALHRAGAHRILATSAAGSLQATLMPGELVVLDDFIDLRGLPPTTYFHGENEPVKHVDFTEPFCPALRTNLLERISQFSEEGVAMPTVYPQGTYLCVPGPRYETPAEVRLFRSWGADVVGMTVAPEAILARELGMSYAAISVVTNLCTGLCAQVISHDEVTEQMARSRPSVIQLFLGTIAHLPGSHATV